MKRKVSRKYYKDLLRSIKALQFVINFHIDNYDDKRAMELTNELRLITSELASVYVDSEEY